ncbi:hypothetical protein G7Y89_g4901 [Cudoniella acicularis]|uniref:Uncharacterized protein n=1 Tax=Cudoniella acicularis TaxID=354080 RepID=A0A8H4W702_9HELO|nr:hypothetical protein G7Y89_g4901 [Cudoniella acicularis]
MAPRPPWDTAVGVARELREQRESLHAQIKNAALNGKPSATARMNKGKIMRTLLGRPATAATNDSNDTVAVDSPQLRPSASQNTIYSAGAPITCLDKSPDGQRAVIAGSKVFKILRVEGSTVTEDVDLRAIISSYATTHDLSAATPDQLNIKAVKWSHGALDKSIITACGNGRITIYDLNRAGEGSEVVRIQEHNRQVHKLAISPFKGNWLLSASQDTTVRSFDLRVPVAGRGGAAYRPWQHLKCNAEAVRDVKWSPTDGMEFACCTDTGVIQKWDVRKPSAPVLKLSAHQGACLSIDWHPDGDHLVSGGADGVCHVWDMSKKADRNQKPRYTFTTPAPAVSTVSWRPACWSATAQGKRAAQIAVSYDDAAANRNQVPTVHIWDLARSSLPFKEIERCDYAPTGLLWNTRDLLWTVDREGHFAQTDVAFSPRVIERRALSNFSFSSSGDVLMVLEERQVPRRRSRPSITSPEVSPSFQHNTSVPILSVSRSDSEEDVVGSFLGPRQKKTHRRRNSGRSMQLLSTTPPSITGMTDNKVMSLDDAVKVTGLYKPQQVMAIGHAPSTINQRTYQYFSNRYMLRMAKYSTADQNHPPTNVQTAMVAEHFARTAEGVGYYRLAQTWRVLGYTMNLLLTRRAEYHQQRRLMVQEPPREPEIKMEVTETEATPKHGEDTPRKQTRGQTPRPSPPYRRAKSIIADEIESTSNVATPLVRPMHDTIAARTREAMHTPIAVEDDVLILPEAAHTTSKIDPIPVPGAVQDDHRASSVDGYDFYGIESISPVPDFHSPQRKQPLRFDYSSRHNSPQRIQPQRHDSGESFQMFSTSGDSQQAKFLGSSAGSDNGRLLRERVSSWENSLSSQRKHRPSVDSEVPTQSESSIGNDFATTSGDTSSGPRSGMPFDPAYPPVFRIQEPSMQSGNNNISSKSHRDVKPKSPYGERMSDDPNIIESDFLPWLHDPDFTISPIDPEILVQRSIDFECQTGSLHAAAMILLFRPLLPLWAIDEIQAGAILKQHHHRLTSMKLFTEAALLRNLCDPLYPAIFAVAQENITMGFYCTSCEKPLENDPLIPDSQWWCPRCKQAIEKCAICKHRELPSNLEYELEKGEETDLQLPLWWYCSGCGHGGHTVCMQAWHAGPEFGEGDTHSGGCCPLEGCLHACLPGKWRNKRKEEDQAAKAKQLEMLVKENTRAAAGQAIAGGAARGMSRPVRRDNREVNQSKAVEGVRVALGVGVNLERKKSVKLIAPGDEGG